MEQEKEETGGRKKVFGARSETEREERKNELKEGKMEREERVRVRANKE